MFSKLNSIIKHPFTTKIIDIVIGGFLVGAVVYFVVEQKEIKPKYATSYPEMVAEATTDPPRLKLLWDNEEIQNVYSIKIAIWNAGRQYLDTNSISATDPIRVTYPPDTRILYADFIRTSRDNLSLAATDLSGTGTKAIQIEIVGDEALEQKDGGILKILYTGQSSAEFTVTGRIKGCKQGFKEVAWPTNFAQEAPWATVVFMALMVPISFNLIQSLSGMMKELRGDRKAIFSASFDLVFWACLLISVILLLWYFVSRWSLSLKWMT